MNTTCQTLLITGEEFEELKRDIQANGLLEPIWLHPDDGTIIDGRNRHRACCALGIQPTFRTWNGKGSLVAFVVSLNLRRRHLTSSQKAVVAVDILPLLEQEARERQREAANRARELTGFAKELADASPLVRQNIQRADQRLDELRANRRVYFIRDGDELKVGIAVDPDARLSSIKTSRPNAVLLGDIAWIPGAESLLYDLLKPHHIDGEWYKAADEVMLKVNEWLSDENCLVKFLTKQANENKATAQAAAILGTNRQYVTDAKKLVEQAPELAEKVRLGELSIAQARQELPKPPGRSLDVGFSKHANEATEQAAKLVGTNRQYVTDAKKLVEQAPELAAKVRAGELSIAQAKREVVKLTAPEPGTE